MENDQFSKDETPKVPKDYWVMFKSSILDQTKDYPNPVAVINFVHNGDAKPLLTQKSYSLWQGKQKSRKTTLLAMVMGSYISPKTSDDCIRFERAGEIGKVLFIDTEQGQSFAARTMKLILSIAGVKSSENLIYCDFREFPIADRIKMIHAAMANDECIKIVVLDGVVDVMEDLQGAEEGHIVITDLLRICSKYNVHVAGVLHQNKTDDNARSYVGLISSQKCEIEIACRKDSSNKQQSIVECKESRGWHFENFAIRQERDQLPYIVQDYQTQDRKHAFRTGKSNSLSIQSLTIQEHVSIVKEIFKDGLEFNDGGLKEQIKIRLADRGTVTESAARQFVVHWQSNKLIKDRKGVKNAKIYTWSSERPLS